MQKVSLLEGKKILITGITGFVGSRLADRISELGADVYGIAKNRQYKKSVRADICNYSLVTSAIKKRRIDICFHLAGESLVETGWDDPYKTFKTNILGTLNILESARIYGLEKVIIASTSHIYGNNRLPYYEEYTPKPSRPYETSKACMDLIAQSYINSFNLPILIARFVNIYGPGDLNFYRLVPKTIKAIIMNKQPLIWGGNTVRDYLYIDDAISAYVKLAQVAIKDIGKNRIFNFGSGKKVSVHKLIEKIITLSGKDIAIKKTKKKRREEIQSQYVSTKMAAKVLGWEAKTSLDEGLKRTIAWYKLYLNRQ